MAMPRWVESQAVKRYEMADKAKLTRHSRHAQSSSLDGEGDVLPMGKSISGVGWSMICLAEIKSEHATSEVQDFVRCHGM